MAKLDQDRKDLIAFSQGKAEGARAIIGRYSSPLLTQASYLLKHDQAMAEDMVQDVFLKLWRNAEQLLQSDKELQLRAWLYRVLHNQCMDQLRKGRPIELEEADQIIDITPSAVENLQKKDRAKYAMALIGQLPERQRSALLMSHFENMGNAEIAQALECSVEAVENLLARARRSLRNHEQVLEV